MRIFFLIIRGGMTQNNLESSPSFVEHSRLSWAKEDITVCTLSFTFGGAPLIKIWRLSKLWKIRFMQHMETHEIVIDVFSSKSLHKTSVRKVYFHSGQYSQSQFHHIMSPLFLYNLTKMNSKELALFLCSFNIQHSSSIHPEVFKFNF